MPRQGLMQEDLSMVRPLGPPSGASLKAAVTAQGAAEHTIVLYPGVWTCETAGGDITVPPNLTLYRTPGASLVIESGVTVTVSRLIDAEADVVSIPPPWVSGAGSFVLDAQAVGQTMLDTASVRGVHVANGATFGAVGGPAYFPEFAIGADLAARISQIMSAMPASGGVIDCGGFDGIQLSTNAITLSKNCTLKLGHSSVRRDHSGPVIHVTSELGATIEGGGRALTEILALHAAQDLIRVESDQPVQIRDLTLATAVTRATNAVGLYLTGGPIAGINRGSILERLWVVDQFIGIGCYDTVGFNLHDSYIVNAYGIGVHLQNTGIHVDAGDSTIDNTTFHTTRPDPTYAVLQVSSGGLKLLNNKFLEHTSGYVLDIGADMFTSILLIQNNSFESQRFVSIGIGNTAGSGGFGSILIDGNHISATTFPTPTLISYAGANIEQSILSNNLLGIGLNQTGIGLTLARKMTITGNRFIGFDHLGGVSTGLGIAEACSFVDVTESNHFENLAVTISNASVTTRLSPHLHLLAATVDLPSIAAGAYAVVTVNVPGVTVGDRVTFDPHADVYDDGIAVAQSTVTAADTVTLMVVNHSEGTVNLPPQTWLVRWYDRLQRF